MKLILTTPVNNLKSEQFDSDGEKLTVGKVMAEALASTDVGGKMKMFLLAQKCYKDESIEVDEVDLSLIKKAVEACKSYGVANNIIIGQTLLAIDQAATQV